MKLRIDGLTVAFGPVRAVDDLDLEVGDGELMAIVGPSGCGKSTTLGFVAGFTRADAGRLYFDGDDVTALSPQRRKIGFVFQDYAIYPHLSAEENIRFLSSSGSYVPVNHAAPHRWSISVPIHVSEPGSPGFGTVQNRQASFPVSVSKAATKPRIPSSPPDGPTTTSLPTTSGADVAP